MIITPVELAALKNGSYVINDIRSEKAFGYGHIFGAENKMTAFPEDKKVIICSEDNGGYAEKLCSEGIDSYHLEGGYRAWTDYMLSRPDCAAVAEQSICGKFHTSILSRFNKAISDYRLVNDGDKIAVCISGGKDSMLMAKLFQEMKRRSEKKFELVFLVMDPGYSIENRNVILRNAAALDIPVTVFETDIFEAVDNTEKHPCFLCAKMRRGNLYSKAKELGCNKIALGHHFDDIIESTLMGMIYGGQMQTMMPKVRSANFEGMELIRPMYLIREESVKAWRDFCGLYFIQCACRVTAQKNDDESGSKRQEIKELIAELKSRNPQIEHNIFRSTNNVKLSSLISYKDKKGNVHHFLDDYDE